MAKSTFVYVTCIRTTREKLWAALTDTECITRYWFGVRCESQWTPGSTWKMVYPDGRTTDVGEIAEVVPFQRIVIRWQHKYRPELKAEGESLCTMELEHDGPAVKFTLTHAIERDNSQFIAVVSEAWPMVISNLKSLLETGSVVLEKHCPTETAHATRE